MTIKRAKDFPPIEQLILREVFKQVRYKYTDGQWHEFKGRVKIRDRYLQVEMIFRLDNMFMTIKDQTVKDGNSRIILPNNYNS